MSAFRPPGPCPNCGEFVPRGAVSCCGCGADERTGWSEETYSDGLDLPDQEEEGEAARRYQRTVDTELGDGLPRGGRAWLVLALVVLLSLSLSGAWWLLR